MSILTQNPKTQSSPDKSKKLENGINPVALHNGVTVDNSYQDDTQNTTQANITPKHQKDELGKDNGYCTYLQENDHDSKTTIVLQKANRNGSKVIKKYQLQNIARQVLPDFRVNFCCKVISPVATKVHVNKNDSGKGANYTGLIRCESPHVCPICGQRIAMQDRYAISVALDNWKVSGGGVAMVTYTQSHTSDDTLETSLSVHKVALRLLSADRGYKAWRDTWGIQHHIRGIEQTYGVSSGWHVHAHEIIFTSKPIPKAHAKTMRDDLARIWSRIIKRASDKQMVASFQHGIDITLNKADVDDYISKQGDLYAMIGDVTDESLRVADVSKELAYSRTKSGRLSGRYTPFMLLMIHGGIVEFSDITPERAKHLFREYAMATFGRNRLNWSRGAKDALGVNDESIKQAMDNDLERVKPWCKLPPSVWQWIASNGLQGEVLAVANESDTIDTFVNALRAMGATINDPNDFQPDPDPFMDDPYHDPEERPGRPGDHHPEGRPGRPGDHHPEGRPGRPGDHHPEGRLGRPGDHHPEGRPGKQGLLIKRNHW